MSEQDNNKRKNLGTIPVAKLEKMAQWKAYTTASEKFSAAKQASSEAKQAVRDALKKRVASLKGVENLEFYMNAEGDAITVYELPKSESGASTRKRRTVEILDFA
jgi:hypothetical protein